MHFVCQCGTLCKLLNGCRIFWLTGSKRSIANDRIALPEDKVLIVSYMYLWLKWSPCVCHISVHEFVRNLLWTTSLPELVHLLLGFSNNFTKMFFIQLSTKNAATPQHGHQRIKCENNLVMIFLMNNCMYMYFQQHC